MPDKVLASWQRRVNLQKAAGQGRAGRQGEALRAHAVVRDALAGGGQAGPALQRSAALCERCSRAPGSARRRMGRARPQPPGALTS